MKVEIWSDVVCPWCYIGKRRFETALGAFDHAADVEVEWHSFELDPRAPRRVEGDSTTRLATKYGMTREQAAASQAHVTGLAAEDGLAFQLKEAKSGNTFDAHRLLHLAADRGIQGDVKERLLAAYLTEGEAIGDRETLVRVVADAGVDPEEARAVLHGDKFSSEVRGDERRAQEIGVTGVPFFLFGGRYAVAGAQPATVLLEALNAAWDMAQPIVVTAAGTGSDEATCSGESCAI
jgi:predicted DsbA family dithiol-disulfide isomerase